MEALIFKLQRPVVPDFEIDAHFLEIISDLTLFCSGKKNTLVPTKSKH